MLIRGNYTMTDKEIKQLVADFTATVLDQNEQSRLERGHQITGYGNHYENNIPYTEIIEQITKQMIDASFTEIKRIFENYLDENEVQIDIDRTSTEYKKG